MPMTQYIGNQGAGKTLKCIRDAIKLARRFNAPIITNIPSFCKQHPPDIKVHFFEKWRELLDVFNHIIVWDEMHNDVDARNFKSRDQMIMTHFFNQLRKRGNHLMYTTQRDRQMDIRIHLQVDKRFELKHRQKSPYFYFTKIDTQSDNGRVICQGFFKGKPFFKYYNTYEIVESNIGE